MTLVVEMKFGSTVYGTTVPESDVDYKRVFLPSGRDIVMCQSKEQIGGQNKKAKGERNAPGAIDKESWSLKKYLRLLAEGQTNAFDMLFTPEHHYVQSSYTWRELMKNRDRLIHKGIEGFLGYCKSQAEKYSLKGERVLAVEKALALLSSFNQADKLHDDLAQAVVATVGDAKYVSLADQWNPAIGRADSFLVICGKKVNFHNKVRLATELAEKTLSSYGDRAHKAADADGMDTKAFYHAVRTAYEAEELLLTGNITFPRPEAPLLLDIRNSKVSYAEVCAIIEAKTIDVNAAVLKSTLPPGPDLKFIEAFVYTHNLREILNYHTYDYKSEYEHD